MRPGDTVKVQEKKVKFHTAKVKFRVKIKVEFHVTLR